LKSQGFLTKKPVFLGTGIKNGNCCLRSRTSANTGRQSKPRRQFEPRVALIILEYDIKGHATESATTTLVSAASVYFNIHTESLLAGRTVNFNVHDTHPIASVPHLAHGILLALGFKN
jgi:hypothetical protein